MAFIGSFLVMLYAGIGLFGLPLSRINEYRHRPHRISDDECAPALACFRGVLEGRRYCGYSVRRRQGVREGESTCSGPPLRMRGPMLRGFSVRAFVARW